MLKLTGGEEKVEERRRGEKRVEERTREEKGERS